jgi:hypothetical protein
MEQKARRLGASEFGLSDRKDKRFYIVYDNKIIHFGLKNGDTFIDHHDRIKRANWRKRHSKIKNKQTVRRCPHNKQKISCFSCNAEQALFTRVVCRINTALGNRMGKTTEEILGCDRKTYYAYIQNKFTGDMSYDKMNELHIDHVIPLGAPGKELENQH